MQIILNGEPFELQESDGVRQASPSLSENSESEIRKPTVAMLVDQRQLNPRQIAVEVNCELIPRENYESATLAAGDSVEVVTLAGGG